MRLVAVSILALVLFGCDAINPPKKATEKKAAHTPTHRFSVISRFGGDVAFDTQTGQLCRTWNWTLPNIKPDSTGRVDQIKLGQLAPTCLSLYQMYPSQADDSAVVVQDDPPN